MSKLNVVSKTSLFAFLVILLVVCVLSGCVGTGTFNAKMCSDGDFSALAGADDQELRRLLDLSTEHPDCRQGLLHFAVSHKRHILNQEERREAMRVMNERRFSTEFHSVLRDYYRGIAHGESSYRPEDREILESYLQAVLARATFKQDSQLVEVLALTRTVDPRLYHQILSGK